MRLITTLLLSLALSACGGGGGGGGQAPAPANRAPTAAGAAVIIRPDTVANGTLSATDADGDTLSFALVAAPNSGSVTLSGTGNRDYEYSPDPGFAGVDTFTFTASDGTATSNTATVTITVNTPPVVTTASYTTSDIGTISDTVLASDPDGDPLTFAVATPPTRGALTTFDASSGAFVYTPDPAEDGVDSFEVTASDTAETSAEQTITVEIFGWAGTQQFGTGADDEFSTNGLSIDPDGLQLQAGGTDGALTGAPNQGQSDVFLRTTDRRGNETSMVQFGDISDNFPRGLHARTQGGGYYVSVTGDGDNLFRFDASGNEIWSVPVDLPAGSITVTPVYWSALDTDDNLYVLSWLQPPALTSVYSAITKIDGDTGNPVWQRELTASADDPTGFFIAGTNGIFLRGVDFDSNGDVLVTGGFLDDGLGGRNCSRCAFIAKLDADTGADVWLREPDTFETCGRDTNGRFYRVSVAADDTLYLSGISGRSTVATDGAFARFSADGATELWSYCDNSGDDWSLFFSEPLLTRDGGVIFFGDVGDATSPPGTGGEPTIANLVIHKFDADGNLLWNQTIGATKADGSGALMAAGSIAEDAQGILYITGFTDGELTDAPNAGGADNFVIRLSPDGGIQ